DKHTVRPRYTHRPDRVGDGMRRDVPACVRAAWAQGHAFFLQPEKEQPADARRAARLRAPLPTPGCGWFSLPIAQRAKHFERLNGAVPATSRLAARPVAEPFGASDQDPGGAIG